MRWAWVMVLLGACGPDLEPYTVSREIYPTTAQLAGDSSVDFDGDRFPDNQLGMVIAALYVEGLDPNAGGDALIDAGTLVQELELDGASQLSPAEQLTLNFFGDVVTLALREPQVVIDATQTTTSRSGIIVGGVRRAEVEAVFAPPFARELEAVIARECTARTQPGCGCTVLGQYDARHWLARFDTTPQDCTITTDEILGAELTQQVLTPDITIDGEPLLSFGIRFEAVPR